MAARKLRRASRGGEGCTTKARRARARATTPDEAARFVLGAANIVAGCLELLSRVSEGQDVLPAARKAVRGAKKRGKALEDTYVDTDEEEPSDA